MRTPTDTFNGDTAHLIECIKALLEMNEEGALRPYSIGGHAASLLSAAAVRLAAPTRTEFEAAAYRWMTENFAVELLKHFPAPRPYCDATEVVHDAIAAAMGWPTVPEKESPCKSD